MANTITEQVIDLNKRVGSLETKDLDAAAGLARIIKLYGKVKITTKITVSKHQYPVCGTTTICRTSLII